MSLPVTQDTLSCFDDIITLDGCSEVPSTSGFTMGDLGITLDELNHYVNKEYTSGAALFEAKKSFAIKQIASQIHQHLQPQYKGNTLIDSKRVGFVKENLTTQNIGSVWAGQKIEVLNTSSFMELFISEVTLLTNYTGVIEIRIYDLQTGQILKNSEGDDYSFTVNSIGGEQKTIYPQISIRSNKKPLNLAIVYSGTGITPYQVETMTGGCTSCDPCSRTRYSSVSGVIIPSGVSMIDQNTVKNSLTGGMSIVYSINCNYDGWLCSISNLMARSILFKTAFELMDYAVNISNRLNPKVDIDYEVLKSRRDEYEFRYREMLDICIKNIKLPSDANCFECSRRIIHTITMP